jgi:predicted RecA/RadA family phage recombinase
MPIYNSTGHSTGEQCSSTYEGRHITILGSNLLSVGTVATTGLVKGEAVVFGDEGVGVVFNTVAQADRATTYVAVDTEGIWWLNVVTSATMAPGDTVYIHSTTGVVSDDDTGGRKLGYVVDDVADGSGSAVLAPVKVHKG